MTQLYKHPLLRQCYDVMQQIEVCGASVELTKAVTMAGDLLHAIDAHVDTVAPVLAERDALREQVRVLREPDMRLPDLPKPDYRSPGDGFHWRRTDNQVRAIQREAYIAGLEEAAKIADDWYDHKRVAAEIRALKEQIE